jgi:hypothetical protein
MTQATAEFLGVLALTDYAAAILVLTLLGWGVLIELFIYRRRPR